MHYIVTMQYLRGEETLVAEFCTVEDAHIFLNKRISVDQFQAKKKMYRLYGHAELLQAFNPEHLSMAYAKHAEGDCEFITPIPFFYHVKIQMGKTLERKDLAHFENMDDAHLFMIAKCEKDVSVGEQDLFGLFKEKILLQTLSKMILTKQKVVSESAKGQESTSTFHPTPTPTRPTPPGGPSDCWIEKEEEDDV